MQTGILVPVLLRDGCPLRYANFLHVIRMIEKAGYADHAVIAVERTPTTMDLTDLINSVSTKFHIINHHYDEDEGIHKSALVNAAAEELWSRGKQFALMIDADIHLNVKQVMAEMESLNPNVYGAVKPFRFFIRLDLPDSAKVRAGENVTADLADYPEKEIVDYPAAGSWAFSKKAFEDVGGMDEQYVGWGWEDSAFSHMLRKQFPWITLEGAGFHLEHENDRQINQENYSHFLEELGEQNQRPEWEEMAVHVKKKLVVISVGRAGSTLLAKSLANHPDVEMFKSQDPREEVKGTNELFDPVHFSDEFPNRWNHKTLLRYLGDRLTDTPSNYHGFKLMMDQPSKQAFRLLLSHFNRQSHNYKVIFVFRQDLFAQALSYCYARETKEWVKEYSGTSLALNGNLFRAILKRFDKRTEMIRRMLPEALLVSYERLVTDWEGVTTKIQEQLGLKVESLEQATKKQGSSDWGERVVNLPELESIYDEVGPTLEEAVARLAQESL